MTPPADKLMDRSEAVNLARFSAKYPALRLTQEAVRIPARAVLATDEELCKAALKRAKEKAK